MRILIVEDYAPTFNSLKQGLEQEGYIVDIGETGDEGLLLAKHNPYDVVLLDVMLPGIDGWEVLKQLREAGSKAQIIMLTAKDTTADKVRGLDTGADDYLVKPFSMDELKARLRAASRNLFQKKSPILTFHNGLAINTSNRTVELNGAPVKLTPKEYSLLNYLALRQNELVTRSDIWENVYEYYSTADSNVVDVYIARLRKKLNVEGQAPIIQTHRGQGYILCAEDD